MNWKINYWTLVTFIILGGLIYSCMGNESSGGDSTAKKEPISLSNTEACDHVKLTIDRDTVVNRRTRFHKKMKEIQEKLEKPKNPSVQLPINFGTGYLKLPKCELERMWKAMPTEQTEVYIYLTLEDIPASFKEKGTMISAVLSETEKLKEEHRKTLFFDFIKPCPPACGK